MKYKTTIYFTRLNLADMQEVNDQFTSVWSDYENMLTYLHIVSQSNLKIYKILIEVVEI